MSLENSVGTRCDEGTIALPSSLRVKGGGVGPESPSERLLRAVLLKGIERGWQGGTPLFACEVVSCWL